MNVHTTICVVCGSGTMCKAATVHRVGHIRQTISRTDDGPITPFVLIKRAMDFAYSSGLGNAEDPRVHPVPQEVGDALHEELTERGWLVDDADAIEVTGS